MDRIIDILAVVLGLIATFVSALNIVGLGLWFFQDKTPESMVLAQNAVRALIIGVPIAVACAMVFFNII